MNILLILLSLACTMVASQSLNMINEQFNKNFLTVRIANHPNTDIVVSTYSLLTPLTQLLLASQGETRSEILKVIGVQSEDILRESLPKVTEAISNTNLTIKEASKIYVQKDLRLNTAFIGENKALFGSDIESVDFNLLSTINEINSWIEQQTNYKIKDILNPEKPLPNTKVLLANAIYFKANWIKAFEPSETRPEDFHINNHKTVKLPFMHQQTDFKYAESNELNAKLIELPYDGDQEILELYFPTTIDSESKIEIPYNMANLLLVVPNEIEGLKSTLEKLNPTTLQNAKKQFATSLVDLSLPKFKIETTTDLRDVLEELGLKSIFSNEANLTNLVEGNTPVYVSDATQKAFIEVNEEGTEAAAANTEDMDSSMPIARPNPIPLIVDRPFYFEIVVENMTLFSGVKTN